MSHFFTLPRLLFCCAVVASCGGSPGGMMLPAPGGTGGAFAAATGGKNGSATGGADASAEGHQSTGGSPFDGGGPSPEAGPSPDAGCAQVGCHTPPPNSCEGAVLKTYYDPNGNCTAGACDYRFSTQTCPHGCQAGQCLGETGVDGGSDMPPACYGAACDAGQNPSTDGGRDLTPEERCAQMRCDAVPANVCVGSMLKTYPGSMGTCVAGACTYQVTTQECPLGCENGACVVKTCTPGSAAFTADVIDVNALETTGALPALAGGVAFEIRSYMQVKTSYAGIRLPIYAPTGMTLYSSVHYQDPNHIGNDPDYQGEWGLAFEASCTTNVTFAHIREVVDKISAVTVGGPGSDGIVARPVNFAAGELIGYYIQGTGYYAWDFVVQDSSVTNSFVNQARYEEGTLKFLHAICPFDLYPPTMRDRYLALLGGPNDPPKAGRKCGTVAHDKKGTPAGAWFRAPYTHGTPTEARAASGNPLAIFKAETDAVYIADLDAKLAEVGSLVFRIDPWNPTYRDPETITSSHCYERHQSPSSPPNGWAYLQVFSDTELRVAYSTEGGCPGSFPTTGIDLYYR